jgi:hypothetical protein
MDLGMDLWTIIFSYSAMSVTDIYECRLLTKKLLPGDYSRKHLQLLACWTMRRLLRNEFGLSFDDLIEVLGRTKSVISGSFPLQSILGVKKTFDENSDIDIYLENCSETDPMHVPLYRRAYIDYSPMEVISTFLLDNNYAFSSLGFDGYEELDGYKQLCSILLSTIKTFRSCIKNSLGQRKKIRIIEMK